MLHTALHTAYATTHCTPCTNFMHTEHTTAHHNRTVNQSLCTLAPKALKMVTFFSPNTWQILTFLNPLNALIPKIPFSFFAEMGSGSPPGPGGQSPLDFAGPIN